MDKHQMAEIYEKNAAAVFKYLLSLTRDRDISEELTQETFYQATKGIRKFRGDCKPSVWLCQIAKRLWYKELEKKKKHPISLEEVETELTASANTEQEYLDMMEKTELFRLLHQFEDPLREVMYLRLSGDLSFAQIGEILGQTETWARVTFYRGKQKLLKGREKWNKN